MGERAAGFRRPRRHSVAVVRSCLQHRPMPPHRPQPAEPPDAVEGGPRPGDPVDPVRARQGRRFISFVLVATLLLYLGMAMFAFGPNGPGLGAMNRLFGWESPVLAALPFLLLFWAPILVLRLLPRRPENAFLCGAQDALDPTRNPNWRRPILSSEVVERRMRRLERGAVVVAGAAVIIAAGAYVLTSRPPPNAGRPLPALEAAALAKAGDAALPVHARVVGAEPGYDQAWIHVWSVRQTTYEDVYFPLRAAGQPPGAPVFVVEKATYVVGEDSLQSDPPKPPFEGELKRATYPSWMTDRMRTRGFTLAPGAVELKRMKLDGREPGVDPVGPAMSISGGVVVLLTCLLVAVVARLRRRSLADVPRAPTGKRRRR
jgi:hypothetical protein